MSQNEAIKAALLSGRSLTHLDALREFGCARLAARILDLRRKGMEIECSYVTTNGKWFASYRLRGTPNA